MSAVDASAEGALAGRVVMITGAALAGSTQLIRVLAPTGCALALAATVEVNARARKAQSNGVQAMTVAVRWWNAESVNAGVARVLDAFGRIDALVHIDPEHVLVTADRDRIADAITTAGARPRPFVVRYEEPPRRPLSPSVLGADALAIAVDRRDPGAAARESRDLLIAHFAAPGD